MTPAACAWPITVVRLVWRVGSIAAAEVSSQRIVSAFIFSPSACIVGMKKVGTEASYPTSSLMPTISFPDAAAHGRSTAQTTTAAATSVFIPVRVCV